MCYSIDQHLIYNFCIQQTAGNYLGSLFPNTPKPVSPSTFKAVNSPPRDNLLTSVSHAYSILSVQTILIVAHGLGRNCKYEFVLNGLALLNKIKRMDGCVLAHTQAAIVANCCCSYIHCITECL